MYFKVKNPGILKKKSLFFLLLTILLFPTGHGLAAQDLEGTGTEESETTKDSGEEKPEPTGEDLLRNSISLDVETSSYYELQNWLLRLGMDTSGTKKDLQTRLLRYYEKELGGLPSEESTAKTDSGEAAGIVAGEMPPPAATEGEDGTGGGKADRMEIISAGSLEYLLDEREDRLIRIDGGVVLKMKDTESGTTHTVEAGSIIFDRARNSVTAVGNVFYSMDRDGSGQEFEGDKISFNIENFRGVFIQGVSRRTRTIEGQPVVFYFMGDTIYRIRRDTVRLERGIISSSKMDDPYYSIKAGNVWILGLNEWALRDAVLYIGHVPVFYIPFFYRPGDTFVFHPSIGMRSLEGYYTQTSTYFLGRKPEDSESEGMFSFLQVVDDDRGEYGQELKGLFLHGTRDRLPETWVNTSDSYGKFQFDYYSRLGILTGVNLMLQNLGNFKKISLTSGIGVTNYIYTLPGYADNYSPFYYDSTDQTYNIIPQEPYLLGKKMPLRFGLDLELEYGIKSLTFKMGLPLYTDLLLRDQLTKRNEELGWSKMLTGEGILELDTFEEYENPKFYQHMGFRLGFLEKSALIDSFQVSKLDSQLLFSQDYLPEDENAFNKLGYYYPELFTPVDLNFSVRGTLLKGSGAREKDPSPEPTEPDVPPEPRDEKSMEAWTFPEDMRNPIESSLSSAVPIRTSRETDAEATLSEEPGRSELKEPERIEDIGLDVQKVALPFSHSLTYTFSPDLSYHTRMDTDAMSDEKPEEVGFDPLYSYVFTDGNASLLYSAKMFGDRISFSQSTRFQGRYRDHFNGENLEELIEQDRSLSYLTVLGTTEVKHYFLKNQASLENSYLMYSIEGDIFDYSYNQDTGIFESRLPTWNEEGINRQKSDLVLVYKSRPGTQKLQFSYSMPPGLQAFDTVLALQTGPLSSTLSLDIEEKDDGNWDAGPFRVTENLSFGDLGSFEQNLVLLQPEGTDNTGTTKINLSPVPDLVDLSGSFIWNFSTQQPQNGTASISLGWWTNRYEQRYMEQYDFTGSAWTASGNESFQPYLFTSTLAIPYDPDPFWKNRIRFDTSLSASLQYNLIRYNESYFQFSWDTHLQIEEFLDFRFSIKSTNNAMYRYIPAFSEELGKEPLNLIDDLMDSFNFFDSEQNARKRSNFNLQSISFSLVHYMHDWQLNMTYSGAPELDETNIYEWRSEFSIFVQWNPIPEVRKQIDYSGQELQF